MGMLEMEKALQLIRKNASRATFFGGASDRGVARAEERLNVALPPTYRRFLRALGAGGIDGSEFYGLVQDDLGGSVPDAVWLTLEERRTWLPAEYVIVAQTGGGEDYVLDTSRTGVDEECPILLIHSGDNTRESAETVASDFGDFFLHQVEEALAEKPAHFFPQKPPLP